MVASAYANQYTYETSVNGLVSVNFPWRSRTFMFSNDSGSNSLQLIITNTTATVKPGETLTTNLWVRDVAVSGSGPFRIWIYG